MDFHLQIQLDMNLQTPRIIGILLAILLRLDDLGGLLVRARALHLLLLLFNGREGVVGAGTVGCVFGFISVVGLVGC